MGRIGDFIVHHWLLVAAAVVILGLLIGIELRRKVAGLKDIPPGEAVRLINRENAVILDVREDRDYEAGHIINAVHVPLGLLDARAGQLEKYKGQPIIVCGKGGQESSQVGGTLRGQGFETVYNLGGGLAAWTNANLPLEK